MNWHRVNVKDTISFNLSDEQFNNYMNQLLPTDLKDKVFNLLTFINTWYDKNPDSTILTNAGKHTFYLQRKTFNLDLSYQNGLLKYFSEVLKDEKQYYAGKCVNVGEKAGVSDTTAYFTVAISINHELVRFDAEIKDNLLTIFI